MSVPPPSPATPRARAPSPRPPHAAGGWAAPAVVFLLLVFWGGLASALVKALGQFPAYGFHEWTFAHFGAVWGEERFLAALGLTARVAAGSTVLAVAGGVALAALAVVFTAPGWRTSLMLKLPLVLPHMVAAYVVVLWLSQSGIVARVLHALGLLASDQDFPNVVHDAWGIGIMGGFALKEIPFVAVMAYPFLLGAEHAYGRAGRTLGAGHWQRLTHVMLPLARPAVASAGLITFAYGFSSFEIPFVLAQTYPRTLSNWAVELFESVDPAAKPQALAVALYVGAINMAVSILYFRAARRYEAALALLRAGQSA